MPASPSLRPVHIKPVTGVMDVRSNPDEVEFGGYRLVLNTIIDEKKRLRRMSGWRKAFYDASPNNWDLHDQDIGEGYTPQQITMLFQAETPIGFSKLYAGTQNRIYSLNSDTGNWRCISDELGGNAAEGCGEVRFTAGQVNETIVFTNGIDKIVYHVIDQPPTQANDQSVAEIEDLVTLNVTRAKAIVAWNNMIILLNVEMDGEWRPNRFIWSDFNRPLSFIPSSESLAGYHDLDWGDAILAAKAIKNSLLIYTTRGIWEVRAIGGEEVFSVVQRWKSGDGGKRTLAFKNTLVSTGEDHYYFGNDNIYRYNLFIQEPEVPDWIDKATPLIFDDIDFGRCGMHVGGYQGQKNQVWFSWGRSGELCPTQTLILNLKYPFTTKVDVGISAFLYHEPDTQMSLRSFILERCICTIADLEAYGGGFIKEGGFCIAEEETTCNTVPASYYSQTSLMDGDVEVEDWVGDPDADSLYSILGSIKISEICEDEYNADECNAERIFLFATVSDKCLKQAADVLYREQCTGTDGCGTYEATGYRSRLLSSAMDLKLPDDDKLVRRFAVEAHTITETVPAQVLLKIGIAAQAIDPLTAGGICPILWEEEEDRELECLGEVTAETHQAEGTRPNDPLEWAIYQVGRYLYFDIEVLNANSTPEDTGGDVCFSRFTFDAAAVPRGY